MSECHKYYGTADAGADPAIEKAEEDTVGGYIYQDNGNQRQRRDYGLDGGKDYRCQRTEMPEAVQQVQPEVYGC